MSATALSCGQARGHGADDGGAEAQRRHRAGAGTARRGTAVQVDCIETRVENAYLNLWFHQPMVSSIISILLSRFDVNFNLRCYIADVNFVDDKLATSLCLAVEPIAHGNPPRVSDPGGTRQAETYTPPPFLQTLGYVGMRYTFVWDMLCGARMPVTNAARVEECTTSTGSGAPPARSEVIWEYSDRRFFVRAKGGGGRISSPPPPFCSNEILTISFR